MFLFVNEYNENTEIGTVSGKVLTGFGFMDVRDYLNIRASDAGYGSYKLAYEAGWRLRGYEYVEP